jgi:hypothetical protein
MDGDGDCVQMEFEGVPKFLDIPPRANVQLLVDGSPVWFGTVVRSGAPGSGRSWRYVALGGRHMLKYAYANYTFNDPNTPQDIATLASNAWDTVQNKPLNPTMSTRPTGYTLTRLTAQWVDMHTLLSDLARAAGDVPWGVDATGQLFFNKLPTSSRVSASQVDIDPLPVDADDVWGTVILYHPQSGYAYRYVGDARYGERVVAVPNMLDYMDIQPGTYYSIYASYGQLYRITPTGRTATTTIDPKLLMDLDSKTGYNIYKPASPAGSTCSTTDVELFAFNIDSSFWSPGDSLLIYTHTQVQPVTGAFDPAWNLWWGVTLYGPLGAFFDEAFTLPTGQKFNIYHHPGPGYSAPRLYIGFIRVNSCSGFSVDILEFIVARPGARLQSLAQSLLQPPYLSPQDIRITGYVAPANYLYIDGLGTFEIDTWEYDYTAEKGLLTTARVGRRGSEHQQSQRLAITGLSREWAERLRLSIGRTP